MTEARSLSLANRQPKQNVYRALEQMMHETLSELVGLKREVAELRTVAEAIGYRDRAAASKQAAASDPALPVTPMVTVVKPDFDWEAWARDLRARIRGFDAGASPA